MMLTLLFRRHHPSETNKSARDRPRLRVRTLHVRRLHVRRSQHVCVHGGTALPSEPRTSLGVVTRTRGGLHRAVHATLHVSAFGRALRRHSGFHCSAPDFILSEGRFRRHRYLSSVGAATRGRHDRRVPSVRQQTKHVVQIYLIRVEVDATGAATTAARRRRMHQRVDVHVETAP